MLALIERADHALFFFVNGTLHWMPADPFVIVLSDLGRWGIVLVALAVLAPLSWRVLARHAAVLMAFVLAGAAVNAGIKESVYRSRPQRLFRDEIAAGAVRVNELEPVKRRSFPSGHSMLAFLAMTYAGLWRRRHRAWMLGLAFLIALSRIYVGAHFPLDCLVGGAMGAGWAVLAGRVFASMERRGWRLRRAATS